MFVTRLVHWYIARVRYKIGIQLYQDEDDTLKVCWCVYYTVWGT